MHGGAAVGAGAAVAGSDSGVFAFSPEARPGQFCPPRHRHTCLINDLLFELTFTEPLGASHGEH
jgi:hypothetical protein